MTLKDWAGAIYVVGILACTAAQSEQHGLIRSFFASLIWPVLIPGYIHNLMSGKL
jgi:hypothetical protein